MSVDERVSISVAPGATDGAPDRAETALIVAWQHPTSRLISPVGLLEELDDSYRFRYLRRAVDVDGFQPFLGFPDWTRTYLSALLFPLFSQRVMSDRRGDFPQFLAQLSLGRDATPWEQLARSEGRRTGDTVQVFPVPRVRDDGSSTCLFLVHGIRHVVDGPLPPLSRGEELRLVDVPDNPVNPDAVLIRTVGDDPLGYVPDLLLEHLRALECQGPVSVRVEHVNGSDAPIHLRLLARLDGTVPSGYRPMAGRGWRTFDEPQTD